MAQDPQGLGAAISRLITLRGLARSESRHELSDLWQQVAGKRIAAATRVHKFQRGVLQIQVSNSALLSELVGFQRQTLLTDLQQARADLQIREIRFRLRGEMATNSRVSGESADDGTKQGAEG